MIDLHCDTISVLYEKPACGSLAKNCIHVDLDKLIQGGSSAQFFAMFVDQAMADHPFDYCNHLIDKFYAELALNQEHIAIAHDVGDYQMNQQKKKISAFLTIEEGGVLKGDLANLHQFYQRGVRLLTLTWNYVNEIGFPNADFLYQEKGLTPFGKEVVQEMNRLGMIVDVSHLSDGGFYDVAKISSKPFVASHSNSRTMTKHSRNLTDDMIRVLASKGGVMGINFSGDFLGGACHSQVEDIIRHIRYIYRIGGSDVIALGTDFDGIHSILEIEDFSQMDKLITALKRSGFTSNDIDKICEMNCLRVMKDCLSK